MAALMNPPTPGRQPVCLRALHANAGAWLTPHQLAELTGWTPKNAATSALNFTRAGYAERRALRAANRFEYRFVQFPPERLPSRPPPQSAETGLVARSARRAETLKKRHAAQQEHAARILAFLHTDPARAFTEREIVAGVDGLTGTQTREALAMLTVQTRQVLISTPRYKERQATGYRVASSGLSAVQAGPLTADAQALFEVLKYGTARNISVTRGELLARVQGDDGRLRQALALVEANGLLELRPVGNLLLYRALTSGKAS
ncbi:hypothetical protein [Deinococcus sp. QL22]|uniref:hypothetical protein n=1 Tax=Deinococcus sp. QL22 TaxID=2939437 RepID=UPI002016ADE5|nr:hypothetical protein [Deinococcus sp. QL22]UQN10328.1 hypothetical protein M1R55_29695 [Deinococcus sp. QL22]UQN10462.1 hypothetical protein M1R55_29020 [Deinococcus sp. QL22]